MAQITAENNPAARSLDPPEIEVVATWRVACDGGEGALGHPRVWLQIPVDSGWIDCGYCDKRFIHESWAAAEPSDAAAGREGPEKVHPLIP